MAVYRRKGEIVIASVDSVKDSNLGRDKSADLVGVYSMGAKPEWIEADLCA